MEYYCSQQLLESLCWSNLGQWTLPDSVETPCNWNEILCVMCVTLTYSNNLAPVEHIFVTAMTVRLLGITQSKFCHMDNSFDSNLEF